MCPKGYTNKIAALKEKVEHHSTNFGARLRALIERKGVGLQGFRRDYDLSESQLHNWLKRDAPPLAKHWPRLAEYFGVSTAYLAFGTPEKSEPESYRISGGLRTGVVEEESLPYGGMLTPGFQPRPAEPTEQQCMDHFLAYLAAARSEPGGLGFTWRQLQKHFPLDEFAPAKKTGPAPASK